MEAPGAIKGLLWGPRAYFGAPCTKYCTKDRCAPSAELTVHEERARFGVRELKELAPRLYPTVRKQRMERGLHSERVFHGSLGDEVETRRSPRHGARLAQTILRAAQRGADLHNTRHSAVRNAINAPTLRHSFFSWSFIFFFFLFFFSSFILIKSDTAFLIYFYHALMRARSPRQSVALAR